jgi:hypothetical protein
MDGLGVGPWLGLFALGAGHGLNPGMGWLFAVALGLQEGRARAVWRALPPMAAGHALAVLLALAAAASLGTVFPAVTMRWVMATLLLGFGFYRLLVNRHPRFGGMRVGPRDLVLWSLLMASAHGAGLMVIPFAAPSHPAHGLAHASMVSGSLAATCAHTLGYLAVTGLVALLVYRKVGLRFLRTSWINLDLVWGGALLVTGVILAL